MISSCHVLEFVIEFINPVDLFDVIYQLKIQTRNDFITNTKKIVICRLSPYKGYRVDENDMSNRFSCSEFIKKHANIWNTGRIIYAGFERNFLDYKEEYKQDYLELHNNLDGFDEYYNNIIQISNELEIYCDKIELTEREFNLIESVKKFPNLKENIKFIGWKDSWITE